MDKLINLIDRRIDDYSKSVKEGEELELLKKVLNVISTGNIKEAGIDSFDVLKAMLISYIPGIDLYDAEEMSDSVSILHNNLSKIKEKKREEKLYDFLDVIKLINHYHMQDMFEIINPHSQYYKKPNMYLELYDEDFMNMVNNFHKIFTVINKNNKKVSNSKISKYKKETEKVRLRVLLVDKLCKYSKEFMNDSYDYLVSFSEFLQKTINYPDFTRFFLVFASMNMFGNYDEYFEEVNKMKNIIERKINKINISNQKKNNARIEMSKRYIRLKNKIINFDDNEIADSALINDIESSDIELKNEYYNWAIEHNDKIYKSLDINQHNCIDTLCARYDFDISIFDVNEKEKIYKLDSNRLEEFLKYCCDKAVAKLLLKSPVIADIIDKCDIGVINSFVNLINSYVIHINLFKDHSELLLQSELLLKNIEVLRNKKIDIFKLSENNIELLLLPCDYLDKNVSLLNYYFDSMQIREFDNYEVLCNSKLFDSMDYLIENGMYSDMIRDNSLINYNTQNIVYAFLLSESIGYSPRDLNGTIKSNIVDVDKFKKQFSIYSDNFYEYVPVYDKSVINSNYLDIINKSDNNIISPLVLEFPAVKILDGKFRTDSLTYNICDQVISRNKVLRYLTSLNIVNASEDEISEMIFNSIIINKIMENEDLRRIKKTIDEIYGNSSNKVFIR